MFCIYCRKPTAERVGFYLTTHTPGLACEVELHDLPPELLREPPGVVGACHSRAFLEWLLGPSLNCLKKCSKSRVPGLVGGAMVVSSTR